MDFEALFQTAPEQWNGLNAYPVQMKDYPVFLAVKDSAAAAQQSWPCPWSTVKYLDGLYGMGMIPMLAVLLRLVFRLKGETDDIRLRRAENQSISLQVIQGGTQADITPRNFGTLRKLIARQNGLELPDETENGELLETNRDISAAGSVCLKPSLEDLIYSVAMKAGTSPEEIMGWTVRRFQAAERALDRSVGHLIASVTLAAGGKFKNGNPYPSWKFDREEQPNAVEPLSALSGRLSGSVDQI